MSSETVQSFEQITGIAEHRAAFEQTAGERNALSKESLKEINLEVMPAVVAIMGRRDEMAAIRPTIVDELPKFDVARYDKMPTYGLALMSAYSRVLAASTPPEELPAAIKSVTRYRSILLTEVHALEARELLNAERLRELRGVNSYQYTAFDTILLCDILRDNWPRIQGKAKVTEAEMTAAEAEAQRVLVVLSERDQAPENQAAARDQLQRAFTLLYLCHKDATRAVRYLDEDNLDKIVPQIYATRGPAKKKPQPELPAAPDPIQLPEAAAVAPAPVNPIPPGMPGSDPFIRGAE